MLLRLSAGLALFSMFASAAVDAAEQAPDLTPVTLSSRVAQTIGTEESFFNTASNCSAERCRYSTGKFRLYQMLPERLWFNLTAEASQRFENNILLSSSSPQAGYVLRLLPNITLGYELFKDTSVYANCFSVNDTYLARSLSVPATRSVSWGIRRVMSAGEKGTLQCDFQARSLFQLSNPAFFDLLPGVTYIRRISPDTTVYGSLILQMRGLQYFGPSRSFDPYYTVGCIHRRGPWTFILTDTLVTNYGAQSSNNYSMPALSAGTTMIGDLEINRPVAKRCPSLVAFARLEPVLTTNSGARAQSSNAFDLRVYTGMRWAVSKPSYARWKCSASHIITERKTNTTTAQSEKRNLPLQTAILNVPDSSYQTAQFSAAASATPLQYNSY